MHGDVADGKVAIDFGTGGGTFAPAAVVIKVDGSDGAGGVGNGQAGLGAEAGAVNINDAVIQVDIGLRDGHLR